MSISGFRYPFKVKSNKKVKKIWEGTIHLIMAFWLGVLQRGISHHSKFSWLQFSKTLVVFLCRKPIVVLETLMFFMGFHTKSREPFRFLNPPPPKKGHFEHISLDKRRACLLISYASLCFVFKTHLIVTTFKMCLLRQTLTLHKQNLIYYSLSGDVWFWMGFWKIHRVFKTQVGFWKTRKTQVGFWKTWKVFKISLANLRWGNFPISGMNESP